MAGLRPYERPDVTASSPQSILDSPCNRVNARPLLHLLLAQLFSTSMPSGNRFAVPHTNNLAISPIRQLACIAAIAAPTKSILCFWQGRIEF